VLRDRAERLDDAEAAVELARVEARIPRPLLAAYLAARARNHAVNRAALTLLSEGVIDFLVLTQEDTAPAGLHVTEQQSLGNWRRSASIRSAGGFTREPMRRRKRCWRAASCARRGSLFR